jgi:hypothetical protein
VWHVPICKPKRKENRERVIEEKRFVNLCAWQRGEREGMKKGESEGVIKGERKRKKERVRVKKGEEDQERGGRIK